MNDDYCVYILTNAKRRVLYTGVTGDLRERLREHQRGEGSSFCVRYGVKELVYVERYRTPAEAIAREKKIKAWSRAKKEAMIDSVNPGWRERGPSA